MQSTINPKTQIAHTSLIRLAYEMNTFETVIFQVVSKKERKENEGVNILTL